MLEIACESLTKTFGDVRAVDDVSFRVEPGSVCGFIGPNGSGKTTTLRMLLGLVQPSHGRATIGGRAYAELDAPARRVGAALEAASFHPGRSARNHLRVMCRAAGIERGRADEVLDLVGLTESARRRVGGFSMGMRQRLGLAGAMVGDPGVLVLDEPANGLDPAGIRWLRQYLRRLADEGRTVLVSSHVLSEVQQSVDHIVVISRGRIVRTGAISELLAQVGGASIQVDATDPERLRQVLAAAGGEVSPSADRGVLVTGLDAEQIGRAALDGQVVLTRLAEVAGGNLEQVFFELTGDGQAEPGPPATSAAHPDTEVTR
ncbi:MAG: ABC transporter ATP-binding protein [Actinomycetota bacterium]|nr:ABC transporter ATP-binding protein [Actinomycetota bacterium]